MAGRTQAHQGDAGLQPSSIEGASRRLELYLFGGGAPFEQYTVETLKNKLKLKGYIHIFDTVNARATCLFTLFYFQGVNFGKTFDS